MKKEFSSGGIVLRKKSGSFLVLLIKDGYDRWTWPKGNIEIKESSRAACIREIEEEVGIKSLDILKKIGKTQYYYRLKGELVFKTVFLFLCETKQAKLIIQESEINGGKWFTPEDALLKVEYDGSKSLLKKAIKLFSSLNNIPTKG